ncbi:MAG: alpha-L-fucosidase [Ignavibacteriales bacterium]|nr:MAG: alpha-L-fucosidase [Ignavibacteriaceae bacterium]MBW7873902.1 alpha-L-fucosidase [Ignavibacteria bacterium]MCZ2143339.1 alpha-L-fucosidase [Ignavibacteriales bacterium]MBV6444220.1 hypothetical protein [Ignavibacteriaceae bacterium]MBZ0197989.1 alpha-L-fucosidase [Ignavibacteriaceae bacterium]
MPYKKDLNGHFKLVRKVKLVQKALLVKKALRLSFLFLFLFSSCSETPVEPKIEADTPQSPTEVVSPDIENIYPIPTDVQLKWQDAEMVMFIHFGIPTFIESHLGTGTEPAETFNPDSANVNQWVSVAKETGFKYMILTAKHHSGFCLWPSEYTEYSIKHSPYKGGKGDIVKEFADECHAQGVSFGYYLSLWDMNSPLYGTPAYNDYYVNQTKELCTKYGEVGEIWLDGFLGYNSSITHDMFDWQRYVRTTKLYQPRSLMAIMGPDIRWVGNEDGEGSETDWSFRISHPAFHPYSDVNVWQPSECDVSIRPGWFYKAWDDPLVKSPERLVQLYLNTVGKNSNLLLNVPPMPDGNFNQIDVNNLYRFRQILDNMFKTDILLGKKATASNSRSGEELWQPSSALDGNPGTFWVTDPSVVNADLEVELDTSQQVNYFRVEEAVKYGQRVSSFEIWGYNNGKWVILTAGTTIGRSRILKLDSPVEVEKVRLRLLTGRGAPAIRTFSAFYYGG